MRKFLGTLGLLIALTVIKAILWKSEHGTPPASDQSFKNSASEVILKVAVARDGSIFCNGTPATLDQLGVALTHLPDGHSSVWYYREAGSEETHPNAMKVIKAIAGRGLPIRLSTKPDYSDAIGPDGRSHPEPQ